MAVVVGATVSTGTVRSRSRRSNRSERDLDLVPCCTLRRSASRKSLLKLVVFVGSCREGRLVERLKIYVLRELQEKGHEVSVIDPDDEPNLLAVRKPFHFHEPGEVPPDWLSSLHDIVLSADGYVVISPEYNRCIAPALTSTMNQFPPDSYRHKAGAIITYTVGRGAGLSAAMQLRCFLGELGIVSVPHICLNACLQDYIAEDGTSNDEFFTKRMSKLVGELEWYTAALKRHRDVFGLPECPKQFQGKQRF